MCQISKKITSHDLVCLYMYMRHVVCLSYITDYRCQEMVTCMLCHSQIAVCTLTDVIIIHTTAYARLVLSAVP